METIVPQADITMFIGRLYCNMQIYHEACMQTKLELSENLTIALLQRFSCSKKAKF